MINKDFNESGNDELEQAAHTCNHGLLVDDVVKAEELRLTGLRFVQDVIDVFEKMSS